MNRAKFRFPQWLAGLLMLSWVSLSTVAFGTPVHGVALHGQPKYGPNFTHFDYANPDAPKGGEARFAAIGSFDTFNPFNIKGQSVVGISQLFESLMTNSADEPFSEYGLIAESVEIPADRGSVTFMIRPQAKFHDGGSITADDVLFSFETLKTKGNPSYRFYYASIASAERLDERRVKFTFAPGENRELPLIIGQMPVLSKNYWQDRDFAATTLDIPVGSGPYRIERFEPGRFIVYQRDENYWGKDLPVNRGQHNIDRLRYDYYRDVTVALEAFKAGAYDLRVENVAKQWATGYDFPALREGGSKRKFFPTRGLQECRVSSTTCAGPCSKIPRCVRRWLMHSISNGVTVICSMTSTSGLAAISTILNWRRGACLRQKNWLYWSRCARNCHPRFLPPNTNRQSPTMMRNYGAIFVRRWNCCRKRAGPSATANWLTRRLVSRSALNC
jgi:ABC-type oligopeptide transport system substrate-binding subunit